MATRTSLPPTSPHSLQAHSDRDPASELVEAPLSAGIMSVAISAGATTLTVTPRPDANCDNE